MYGTRPSMLTVQTQNVFQNGNNGVDNRMSVSVTFQTGSVIIASSDARRHTVT